MLSQVCFEVPVHDLLSALRTYGTRPVSLSGQQNKVWLKRRDSNNALDEC